MDVQSVIDQLAEAGESAALSDEGSVVVLYRNLDTPVDSDAAWDVVPVVGFEHDDGDMHVIVANTEADEPLNVAALRDWTATLKRKDAERELYVPEPWVPTEEDVWVRHDMPVVALGYSPDDQMFAFVAFFEGHEDAFE